MTSADLLDRYLGLLLIVRVFSRGWLKFSALQRKTSQLRNVCDDARLPDQHAEDHAVA